MQSARMDKGKAMICGVILAGGEARRMGGQDKGRLLLRGQSLYAHVIDRARPQVDHLILSANGDSALYADLGLDVVADGAFAAMGPLGGVLAALRAAKMHGAQRVMSFASDSPFFPSDIVAQLCAAQGHGALVFAQDQSGSIHPTFALWDVDLADPLAAELRGGGRKMRDVMARLGGVSAPLDAPEQAFFNINTKADLEQAAEMAL